MVYNNSIGNSWWFVILEQLDIGVKIVEARFYTVFIMASISTNSSI